MELKKSGIIKSYGIICYRHHAKYGWQILLIKKPNTYAFCEFINNRYNKNQENHLIRLFNNMTCCEKRDILSLDFNRIWLRAYGGPLNYTTKLYQTRRNKFETNFSYDKGEKLRRLVENSINVETIWEVPKGRKENNHEMELDTAVREFYEETLITSDMYKIDWYIKPYIETYSDLGKTYQSIYYYAQAIGEWDPHIRFNNLKQTSEVSDIKWCNLQIISNLTLDSKTSSRLIKLHKNVVKKIKHEKHVGEIHLNLI